MSDTTTSPADPSATGAAPGGGGSGGTSVGGSTVGLTTPTLPPQYSSGNTGFFTRQTEPVTTAAAIGPDGALYVSGLSAIPYPTGYANVYRIADPTVTTGFDGKVPSGVPQVYANGFEEIQSIGFNNATGDMYVLEYINSNEIYDPTLDPASLPPGKLIKVSTDGTRTTISGDELKLPNYLLVDQKNGDVYAAINNADTTNGEVLRYSTDPATGATTSTVVASGLNNPRGMSFGPDGNLYVLEQGVGTPDDSPDAASAPVIPFIPGLVSERGGYTGSITKVDTASPDGGQERIYTGLPSFREFNPTTGEDRVISIGPNALTITPDGTAYIASGGGLAPETAAAVGPIGEGLQGILKLDGLFGSDPSQATYTPAFNALEYATANGPDGATTLYNTESNLYDIVQGADGKLYTVDAARNLVYGLSSDGTTLDSVTVIQKQPPVLTPPQYAAVVAVGGNPTEQYTAEIANYTFKASNSVPDVPGNVPIEGLAAVAAAAGLTATGTASTDGSSAPPGGTGPAPRGEDGTGTGVTGSAGVNLTTDLPTLPAGASFDPAFPGATDPVTPPVLAGNIYANYYNPFFGNFAPDPSTPLVLPSGEAGSYTVSKLVVFGDRLADNGNTVALQESLGQPPGATAAPYSPTGNFSDGPKWTTDLAQILGATDPSQQQNFAYESATARDLGVPNPFDPNTSKTTLDTFAGQVEQFAQQNGSFTPNDLVTVTFGGNDISLPSAVTPDQGVTDSVNAIISGLGQLADLGAKHFLVSNLPDVTLAPLFSNPDFLAATGATAEQFQGLVDAFNTQLAAGLDTFESQTGLDVKTLDLKTLFDGIAASPENYGFTNITQPVLVSTPGVGSEPTYNPAIVGQDPAVQHGSLFIDPYFNPTALGQAIIAQTARSTLTTTA